MKKASILVVILSTWATYVSAANLYWDLRTTTHDKYTSFIGGIRNELKKSTCFQIPMMGQPPKPAEYVVVKLIVTTTNNIFLALNKSNSYVVGYSDTYNGKQRAFLLKDAPENAKTKAFPEATQFVDLNYGGSYPDLEKNAGIERKNLGLTRIILQSSAAAIFGKQVTDQTLKKNQAKFLLVAVQMIPEAIRFKYIEGQLTAHLNDQNYLPNQKILTIVNQWGTISRAVADASANGNFQNAITLTDAKGTTYKVTNVNGVKQDIALLLYVQKQCAKTFSLQFIQTEWPQILSAALNA